MIPIDYEVVFVMGYVRESVHTIYRDTAMLLASLRGGFLIEYHYGRRV